MNGFAKALFKIIPFALIFCFIAFGIAYLFNVQNLTYLSTETYNGETIYLFDFDSYIRNINPSNLLNAFTTAIDTDAYSDALSSFNQLWDDGYNIGDIAKTIVNALIIVIDTLLIIVDIILIPLKFMAGTMLMGLSLVGINTTTNFNIIGVLKDFRDILTVPMIQPWI